jgi:hypothetical protein
VTVLALTPVTASLKVAVMLLVRDTAVLLFPGVVAVMVGRGPVRKVHVLAAIGFPAASFTAEDRLSVYGLCATSAASGVSVATPVVALKADCGGCVPPNVGCLAPISKFLRQRRPTYSAAMTARRHYWTEAPW